MSAVIRVDREKDVSVVVIDNPPINAGSLGVRAGLLAAIRAEGSNPEVGAIVLIGSRNTFIAGADLREFAQPLAEPQLPTVIAAIEGCRKPVVAALHGAALGGGFELALGCDARIALTGTIVGLPEVTLGVIPGAGGTQRLPRLAGIPKAIAMICTGERISADGALSLGLIDKIVPTDLRSEAIALARRMGGHKRKVSDLRVPDCDEDAIAKASTNALRAGKNRPAVRAAIDSIVATRTLSMSEGLAQERAVFEILRTSREASALRYQFFAERDAGKYPLLGTAQPIDKIAVLGAGTMGSGITIAALDAGFPVVLFEREAIALERGVDRIRGYYESRVKAGKLRMSEADERMARLRSGLEWSIIADADLVIEAVFENLSVKQDVFRHVDDVARPAAILASNTSYIDLDAIASATSRPQDVVGLHFFSPAQVMRLLEVVRGAATSPDVLATCLQLAKRMRKVSVVSANAFGFIGNRIYAAYRRQCEFMLEEGASPQQIDSALESFGFAMGPFAVADMSGLDIAWRMRQSLAATRDMNARYVHIPDLLCKAGRLGQKSGAGYYRYEHVAGPRQADPEVDQIIRAARAAKDIAPRVLSDDEITRRTVLSMANEGALLLEEGVAQRASDIDVVMVNGYGFPKWEGGPIFWARQLGIETLHKDLGWLASLSGQGFVRCDERIIFTPPREA